MKKQITFIYTIAILFVVAIGIHSCKNSEIGETIVVTLKIDSPDFVHKLSDYSTDELYLRAVNAAIEKQDADTTRSFINLFGDAWSEVAPDIPLASIFGTYKLREYIRPFSTNEEVIAVLYNEWDFNFTQTINILRLRMEEYGIARVGVHRVGSSDIVQLKISNAKNPERLINLLTQTGEFEIWETYNNVSIGGDPGVFEMLTKADELIKEQVQISTSITENNINKHPLFAILQPLIDTSYGDAYHSGCVGVAAVSDTAKVNQMLSLSGKHGMFPENLQFFWSIKSNRHEGGKLDLIAVKVNMRNGKAPLDGSLITEAKVKKQELGWDVHLTMNREGRIIFSRLTADNISRALAFVIDDRVFSYPIVNTEISGGQCVLASNSTKEEAEDIAILLNSGKLPIHVQLIAKAVEENAAQQ